MPNLFGRVSRGTILAGLSTALLLPHSASAATRAADLPALPGSVVDRDADAVTTRDVAGQMHTRIYPEDVNFREGGEGAWRPIDLDLETAANGAVRPTAVDGAVEIPNSLRAPLSFEREGHQVDVRLIGATGAREVEGSEATFADALPNIDAQYAARANGLKETVVLRNRAAAATPLRYSISSSTDLVASASGDHATLRDAAGTAVFRIDAPLAWDSAASPSSSNGIALELEQTAPGRWILTVTPDATWLDDPARVFPVSIDPDYYWVGNEQTTRFHGADADCMVISDSGADSSYCASTLLGTGVGYGRTYKSLLRFDVSKAIPAWATANSATFLARLNTGSTTSAATRVRAVTSSWSNAATWNQRTTGTGWTTPGGDVSTNASLVGPPIDVNQAGYWYYWQTPLAAVNGWIKGTLPNNGLQLAADSATSLYTYVSTDGDQANWPAIDIGWNPDTTAPTGVLPGGSLGGNDQDSLNGNQTVSINASANDDISGVAKLELLRDGGTLVTTSTVSCPGGICPLSATAALPLTTTGLADGAHTLALRATDAAGNVTTTSAWNIYVDRTAPVVESAPSIYRDGDDAWLFWETNDPANADGSEGSGVAADSIRVQTNGAWSSWSESTDSTFELPANSSNLTVQLRTRDLAGNELTASQSTATIEPLTGAPVPANAGTATLPAWASNCTSRYSAADCSNPTDDQPEPEVAAFAAASTNPYNARNDAKPFWGLADPDFPFLEKATGGQPYTASAVVTKVRDNRSLSSQRIIVPYNILDVNANGAPLWPGRRGRLIKQLRAAHDAQIRVMISFETACLQDSTTRVNCNNNGPTVQDLNSVPLKRLDFTKAALALLDLHDTDQTHIGRSIRWISVWNEPFFDNQPFRASNAQQPGAGQAGLQRLTSELADPKTGPCRGKWCEIVSAEVTFSVGGSSANTSAFKYASWLALSRKRYNRLSGSNTYDWGSSSKDIDFTKLKYFGAHDYSEVENSYDGIKTAAWKNSRLARFMSRLPSKARVWLPEIGVFTKPLGQNISTPTYSLAERARQADFLFNKLGRLRLGSNGAHIYRANYYQVCAGASFDTSLMDGTAAPTATSDCTNGLSERDNVVSALKFAMGRPFT